MKFSTLTRRISSEGGDAWAVHYRAQEKIRAGESVIMLSIGQEEDEVTPEHIVRSATASLEDGHHHYTPAAGDEALREAIADYHLKLTGQTVNSKQVTVHSGAQNALFSVALCLLDHGDEVILSEPYYTTYPSTFTIGGATTVSVPMTSANNFLPDPDQLIDSITERTRAIVLNSPSNPLGTVYPRDLYQRVLDACIEKQIFLISDEVYSSLLEPEQRFSPAVLDGAADHVITVSSLSKSHRMTGWRLGWAVGPEALSVHLEALSMCMHYGLPPFIMQAALAAITGTETTTDVPAEIRRALAIRRQQLLNHLVPGNQVKLHDSGIGMFVLLDVSATGFSADQFANNLLEKKNVATLPCTGFGAAGKHLIRVGLCVDGDDMAEAGRRISSFIADDM